ncbi:MAG: T9SS type A sorting domain-containing protein [Flavobacteriales bacterium]
MKKQLLSSIVGLLFCSGLVAQAPKTVTPTTIIQKVKPTRDESRSTTCTADTIHYGLLKEQLIPAVPAYYFIFLEGDYGDVASQAFLLNGSITINGVDFVSRVNSGSMVSSIPTNVALYNVNANNQPTTLITSTTITVTGTTQTWYTANFATPVTVSNNYAVLITPTTGMLDVFANNAANNTYGEGLGYLYYDNLWYTNQSAFNQDFDYLFGPVVTYPVNTNYSVSANPVCVGTAINYINTTSTNVVESRFYNFNRLRHYWNLAPIDSTFVWDMGNGSPLIWISNTSYTHPNAGTYDVDLVTIGGFWNFCVDFHSTQVIINTGSTTISAGGPTTFCDGNNVVLTSNGNGGGPFQWFLNGNPVGTNSNTYTANTTGTYTVQYTLNGCTGLSNAISVTVNTPTTPVISAGGATTFCVGGNVNLSSSGTGNFQWFNGASPVGTNAASYSALTSGSYTVELTDLNGCSATSNSILVTVNPLDDASFTYGTNTLCAGGGNVTPTVNTVPGTFSATPVGLNFVNASTGEIDMSNTANNNYSITYGTNGSCPNSSVQILNITSSPEAEFAYAQASYCQNEANPSPVFVPGGSVGTFSATPVGLSINANGEINLNLSQPGTYTVTNSIAASGACPADSHSEQIVVNETPVAVVSGGGSICDDGVTTIPVTITLTGSAPWNFTYSDGTNTIPVSNQVTSPFVINANANSTYTVLIVSDANCASGSTSGSANVVFNQNPAASLPSYPNVCDNASPFTLTGENPIGGIYSGPGVNVGIFDPSSLSAGTYTIDYDYTDGNGCSGSASALIEVIASPMVSLAPLATICVDAAPVNLSGSPTGGTYSGNGVSGSTFNPTTAGVGNHTITYSVTANGCTGANSQSIVVDACTVLGENFIDNLQVYPNPTENFITLSFNNTSNHALVIRFMTIEGKIISTENFGTAFSYARTYDVTSLAKGTYILQIQSEIGTTNQKVIVK